MMLSVLAVVPFDLVAVFLEFHELEEYSQQIKDDLKRNSLLLACIDK